jgi:hypothetical protein
VITQHLRLIGLLVVIARNVIAGETTRTAPLSKGLRLLLLSSHAAC